MDHFDYLVNKSMELMWLALGIACLLGVIIAGAWWHLFTTGVCALLYFTHRAENKAYKAKEEKLKHPRA